MLARRLSVPYPIVLVVGGALCGPPALRGPVTAPSRGFGGDAGDLPPVLRFISGLEDPAVDQPGRRRQLGDDGRRILLAGVVEDPGQELGPLPRREPAPFLEHERAPLCLGQVLLK